MEVDLTEQEIRDLIEYIDSELNEYDLEEKFHPKPFKLKRKLEGLLEK